MWSVIRQTCLVTGLVVLFGIWARTGVADPVEHARALLDQIESMTKGPVSGEPPGPDDINASIEQLGAMLAESPDDVQLLLVLGRLRALKAFGTTAVYTPGGDQPSLEASFAPAQELFDRAIELDPKNAEAHYWKARVCGMRVPDVSSGVMAYRHLDLDLAIEHAREAVEFAPEHVAYREALASYLIGSGAEGDAMELMKEVDGGRHPIYRILSTWKDLGAPASAHLSAGSDALVPMLRALGPNLSHPSLRVRLYVFDGSAEDVESYYRQHIENFKLHRDEKRKADGVQITMYVQALRPDGARFVPTEKKKDVESARENVITLLVSEVKGGSEETRSRLPIPVGDVYCQIALMNFVD